MSKWTIYHNPRCSKSRQALALLQEKGIEPHIVEYLKTPLTETQLKELISILESEPGSMVRVKDESYKKLKFSLESNGEIARHLAQNSALMERPIVSTGKRAVVGRPPENIENLF